MNIHEGSISYGHVERFKRICSIEEKQWLVKRGYREDRVYSKIEITKLLGRTVLFQIQDKIW